jgi:hypothetical protein
MMISSWKYFKDGSPLYKSVGDDNWKLEYISRRAKEANLGSLLDKRIFMDTADEGLSKIREYGYGMRAIRGPRESSLNYSSSLLC